MSNLLRLRPGFLPTMNIRDLRVASAVQETIDGGTIELNSDWTLRGKPRLSLAEEPFAFDELQQLPEHLYGFEAGFFANRAGSLFFCFDPERAPEFDWRTAGVFVAGSFNGWQEAVGKEQWRLHPAVLGGRNVLLWEGPAAPLLGGAHHQFKFVSEHHTWFDLPHAAPNAVFDAAGNRNHLLTPEKTGQHRFAFKLRQPLDLSLEHAVVLKVGAAEYRTDLQPGRFFFELKTDRPLGAQIEDGVTTFRLFAPRARWVKVGVFQDLAAGKPARWHTMRRLGDGAWECRVPGDLHGWYYWYRLDGPRGRFSQFNPEFNIVDPYALAVVDRSGPAIVIDPPRLAIEHRYYKPPAWQDLVVIEAHVRDLLVNSPILLDPVEKRTFSGLARWIEHRNCYFKRLGVNAVELQPLQEFDNASPEEYHWGYMPVNFFAPESSYGRDPRIASAMVELQEAVEAFHRNGLAVILDVVYNHVGEPNHLLHIDKLYYFEQAADGTLSNWSGCGNDLRCSAAMSRRLICDSLLHFVRFYGVDGFRFDLAELVGVDTLRDIEAVLKRARPGVILIAEPWSFRGHIAGALRDTGFASWNDGFRNFLRDYVHGRGSREGAEYFLRGSPWHFARWPAQTVNYTESHDDRTWVDVITENAGHNGHTPTVNDIRRTHLMAAFLMASVGIPMIHAGQDFLQSKQGVNNTYLRGDLNAIDYRRLYRYPGTHAYFAGWIRFRTSRAGRLMRHFSRPDEGFFQFFGVDGASAFAVVYNAHGSMGPQRILFAINPNGHDVTIPLGSHAAASWEQVADHERFFGPGEDDAGLITEEGVFVPSLGCGLWIAGG